MVRKTKNKLKKDVFHAYLIEGARRTKKGEYPIIERWMVAIDPPKNIIQWNRRQDSVNQKYEAICFYCNDECLVPIMKNTKNYIDKLKKYQCVIGFDASPYDNMPQIVQEAQVYMNLAITYYIGKQGIPIIPNVRLGSNCTIPALFAYPKNTLIAIGTNGFIHSVENRYIFREQISKIVEIINPSGICVYGPALDFIFESAIQKKHTYLSI